MGWARTLFLGDVGNRLDIEDCETDINRMKRELRGGYNKDMSQDKKIQHLSDENAELKLYLASLIRLLISNDIIRQSDLSNIVSAVDSEDGSSDGKFGGDLQST